MRKSNAEWEWIGREMDGDGDRASSFCGGASLIT